MVEATLGRSETLSGSRKIAPESLVRANVEYLRLGSCLSVVWFFTFKCADAFSK